MSDMEIMEQNLRKLGQATLAEILTGFADRVESVEITTALGKASISRVVRLHSAQTSKAVFE